MYLKLQFYRSRSQKIPGLDKGKCMLWSSDNVILITSWRACVCLVSKAHTRILSIHFPEISFTAPLEFPFLHIFNFPKAISYPSNNKNPIFSIRSYQNWQ